MIHNPDVNEDLQSHGIEFIQDTEGKQLIAWDKITPSDIVIIPAFGTTVDIDETLTKIGVDTKKYNTTCPFVEKVWNRSKSLGEKDHTIIIHGKHNHEETRATFSHSLQNAPSLVLKNLNEAKKLADFIKGKTSVEEFQSIFKDKISKDFNPLQDLTKIGVVNQTTMLASETQEITDFLRQTMVDKFGLENIKEHIADTRDTLCYATNDNQSATYGLLEKEADLAIVIGGYNSSNTTHLVELLEQKFKTRFIQSKNNIENFNSINSFDIHSKKIVNHNEFLNEKSNPYRIIITSGASCPDAIVDGVIQKILKLYNIELKGDFEI